MSYTPIDHPIVVVTGNPIDGFTFYGPGLANTPEVEALTDSLRDCDWWYAPLLPVPAPDPYAAPEGADL